MENGPAFFQDRSERSRLGVASAVASFDGLAYSKRVGEGNDLKNGYTVSYGNKNL